MDDFSAKIAANVITEIFKESLRGGRLLSTFLTSKARELDLLGKAANEYRINLAQRYDSMRIFGMSRPVPLRDVYTRVNVLEKITSRQHSTVDELLEILEKNQRRFGITRATKPGIDVVNEEERIILLGKPGSGKTTFLKHIVLEALAGRLPQKRVPVFVSLKDISDSGQTIFARSVREFEISGVPSAEAFLGNLLEDGKCIILLDGLDEVSNEQRERIIREIVEMSEQFRRNKFIVSCRVAAYSYCFEKFSDVELADFGPVEIKTFIDNWFGVDPTKANGCLVALEGNPAVKELASTPLLLTMLCLAYDESMDLSSNRAEIYKDAIEALLKKWDSSRSIKREHVYRNLTTKRKEQMLSTVAATTFELEEYFIPQQRLEGLIIKFIKNLPEVTAHEAVEDGQAVLSAIEAQHGLFVERAAGVYSFSHLTFQEYFTANYIVMAGEDAQRALAHNHLADVRWREIIILVANLLPLADDFILNILEAMTDMGFDREHLDDLRRNRRGRDQAKLEVESTPGRSARRLHLIRGLGEVSGADLLRHLRFNRFDEFLRLLIAQNQLSATAREIASSIITNFEKKYQRFMDREDKPKSPLLPSYLMRREYQIFKIIREVDEPRRERWKKGLNEDLDDPIEATFHWMKTIDSSFYDLFAGKIRDRIREMDRLISDQALVDQAISDLYVAELLAEVLSSSIYLDKEIRFAAIRMARSWRWCSGNRTPESPIGDGVA